MLVLHPGTPAAAQTVPVPEPHTTAANEPQASGADDSPERDDKPFRRLIPNLFRDIKDLASFDSATVLSLGAALSAAAYPTDHDLTRRLSAGGVDQVFAFGGALGSGYVQAGGAIAVYFTGRLADHSKTIRVGSDLIRIQALSGFLTHGAKLATRRDRPGGAPGHLPATFAFPSAHASATFGTATTLWRHFGWKLGVPASLVGAYVGASRLQQNQHFLSDVIFGAALGITAGRTVTVRRGKSELVVVPAVANGGAAVVLVLARS